MIALQIVKRERVVVRGHCVQGGHCRDLSFPCSTTTCRQQHTRYNHETCSEKQHSGTAGEHRISQPELTKTQVKSFRLLLV